MITSEREFAILSLVEARGVVSLRTLSQHCEQVSVVTLRRDLVRMEREGKLVRTRGGATRCRTSWADTAVTDSNDMAADALVLPPLTGRWARTLREAACRTGRFFLAESAPQSGGIYVGPENALVARELGELAAKHLLLQSEKAEILIVTQVELANTRERATAFVEGFNAAFPGAVVTHLIDGRGEFDIAFRQATDALYAFPGVNVLFGVNDHAILAVLEAVDNAARSGGMSASAWSVGGEGDAVFDAMQNAGVLKAVGALFPEVTGHLAIDAIATRLSATRPGEPASEGVSALSVEPVITPFAIVTRDNLHDYYFREEGHWRLIPEQMRRMTEKGAAANLSGAAGKSVRLVLHYPGHEWYRKLASSMRTRAEELGMHFTTRQAASEIEIGIRAIRRMIAAVAALDVCDGESILLDAGATSRLLAETLAARSGLRALVVVTNSLDVMTALAEHPGISTHLTGGEYRHDGRCLIGAGVGVFLSTLRADRAFISPDGVAPSFGLSWDSEAAATVCRHFLSTAREVTVLADHSVVGFESSVHAARLDRVHTVITDVGTLPSQRVELASAGLQVILANDARRPVCPKAGKP